MRKFAGREELIGIVALHHKIYRRLLFVELLEKHETRRRDGDVHAPGVQRTWLGIGIGIGIGVGDLLGFGIGNLGIWDCISLSLSGLRPWPNSMDRLWNSGGTTVTVVGPLF